MHNSGREKVKSLTEVHIASSKAFRRATKQFFFSVKGFSSDQITLVKDDEMLRRLLKLSVLYFNLSFNALK